MTGEATGPELDLDPGESPLPGRLTPATLLCAQYRLVEFVEGMHGAVSTQLSAWCATTEPFAVLALAGPAGAGKTRLAIELCRRLRAEGWHAGFLAPRTRPPPVHAPRRPTLVVLDYADVQPSLRDDVAALASAAEPGGPPLRVVLIARALGEWWTTLGDDRRLAGVIDPEATLEIGEVPLDPEIGARFQRTAITHFAALLGKEVPVAPAGPAGAAPGPLWLLAAGLAQVLGSAAATDPFAAILGHEENLWREAMRHRLDSDRLVRKFHRHARLTVAALVLRGGADDEKELRALAAGLGGEDHQEFVEVLRELYPAAHAASAWVRPLEPDLLGETLVMQTLRRYPDDFERMLAGIDDSRAEQVPRVLLRIAQREGPAAQASLRWLSRLLGHDLMAYAPAVATAVLAGSPEPTAVQWAATLVEALERGADAEAGRRVLERIPEHTTALIGAGAWASEAVGRWLPPVDNHRWEAMRADICELAAGFAQADGRPQRALLWSRQATRVLRELADRDLAYSARLACSLRNLSVMWMQVGEPVAALAVMDECIALCRKLRAEDPSSCPMGILAACLDHRGIVLSTIGEHSQAITSTEEAVSLYRALADDFPERYPRELAAALDNLGGRYRQAGEIERSLTVTEEALAIYRLLADATPDDVFLDFMICLNAAASRRARAGALSSAREAIEEALRRLRPLAAHHAGLRDAFTTSLTNAISIHRTLGDLATAESEEAELAALGERGARSMNGRLYLWSPGEPGDHELSTPGGRLALAAGDPEQLHSLASDHDIRSRVLRQAGELTEALAAAEAAVAALEGAEDPEAALHRLVVLNNLANRQADAGYHDLALATTARTLELASQLAAAGEAEAHHFMGLAQANLAVRHCERNDHAAALPWAEAAVAEIRRQADENLHGAAGLANALGILARCLEGLGQHEAAAAAGSAADRAAAEGVERALGALELPARQPSKTWRTHLHTLLARELSSDELRAWLIDQPALAPLRGTLPAPPASTSELAAALVDGGERHGVLDDRFFLRLHTRLPRCTLQVSLIHALWHTDQAPRDP